MFLIFLFFRVSADYLQFDSASFSGIYCQITVTAYDSSGIMIQTATPTVYMYLLPSVTIETME